jgi:hypothetical protein
MQPGGGGLWIQRDDIKKSMRLFVLFLSGFDCSKLLRDQGWRTLPGLPPTFNIITWGWGAGGRGGGVKDVLIGTKIKRRIFVKFFCIFFWRARVCRPVLRLCRPFFIFEGCLDSNPECCCSKLARYRLSHPSLFFCKVGRFFS